MCILKLWLKTTHNRFTVENLQKQLFVHSVVTLSNHHHTSVLKVFLQEKSHADFVFVGELLHVNPVVNGATFFLVFLF